MRMSTSLTIVYDLGRGRIVWIGRDRDTTTMERFFAWLGRRRARAIHTVCCDMWSIDIDAVQKHLPRAAIVFDRFHLSQHLSRAVDEVRRQTWRQLGGAEKAEFKRTRFLWLKDPENLAREERTRLSTLLRLNSPIVMAYLLKEDLRRFWTYRYTAWAGSHLLQWLWRASHSRLEPFKKLARMLRTHLDGVLVWTKLRVGNGALEGMNNKVKVISHSYRSARRVAAAGSSGVRASGHGRRRRAPRPHQAEGPLDAALSSVRRGVSPRLAPW
jgi:transposase